MFVFVFCVHPTSLSVSVSLAGISCCSNVWFRNCFRAVFSVYISRFPSLIRSSLYVKFCLFVLTKVIFTSKLDDRTFNYLIHLSTTNQGLDISLLQFRLCKQFG